ncbi:MAG: hypothetical protein ABIY70_08870 [Capsulimonas sp.]|uniref:hypothetical protein n=1 Tax=Capsulimonas sp. TaxID=2494211 RepID=UPI0032648A31
MATPSFANTPAVIDPATITAPVQDNQAVTDLPFEVEEPQAFFEKFFNGKIKAKKDPLETETEHQERILKELPTDHVYFFELVRLKNAKPKDQYDYDMKSGILTVFAGDALSDMAKEKSPPKAIPICPLTVFKRDNYDGTNSQGASVNVRRTKIYEYVFNVMNDRDFSGIVDSRGSRIAMKAAIDREKAKAIIDDARVFVGVQFPGYGNSRIDERHDDPTFDDPRDTMLRTFGINVNIAEVDLVADNAVIASAKPKTK